MRCGGEKSSSSWPERTLHIKAARKMADTDILATRRITMALITVMIIAANIFQVDKVLNDTSQNKT
jgi:hypothetical protein